MTKNQNSHPNHEHEHGRGSDHRPPDVPPPEPPGKIVHPKPTHGSLNLSSFGR
jgi:hypothetical protein